MLPVRVGQHEVIQQVREGRPADGYPQFVHGGEIGCRQPPGQMLLCEKHLFGRAVQGLPPPHPPLKSPPHRRGVLPRLRLLDPVPEGLGLEPGLTL